MCIKAVNEVDKYLGKFQTQARLQQSMAKYA